MGSAIGIIANPVSARDIRRVIANATALQITDRANIVLRVLSCVKACGVDKVYMMPENGGIRHHVRRGIDRAENQGLKHFPQLEYLDYKISGTVEDTFKAARMMKEKGVSAIVVLGGDGTHRVSLDEVIKTMRETGADMLTKYKETARGGLAVNIVEC